MLQELKCNRVQMGKEAASNSGACPRAAMHCATHTATALAAVYTCGRCGREICQSRDMQARASTGW